MKKEKLIKAIIKKYGSEISLKETPHILFEIIQSFRKEFTQIVFKKPINPIADEPGSPEPRPEPPRPPHPPGEPGVPKWSRDELLIETIIELNRSIKILTKELKSQKRSKR